MYAMQDVDAIGHMPATLQITIVYSANARYFRPNFMLSETQSGADKINGQRTANEIIASNSEGRLLKSNKLYIVRLF